MPVLVGGEALHDLVIDDRDALTGYAGGRPGAFLGRLSHDRLGAITRRCSPPTTSATYRSERVMRTWRIEREEDPSGTTA